MDNADTNSSFGFPSGGEFWIVEQFGNVTIGQATQAKSSGKPRFWLPGIGAPSEVARMVRKVDIGELLDPKAPALPTVDMIAESIWAMDGRAMTRWHTHAHRFQHANLADEIRGSERYEFAAVWTAARAAYKTMMDAQRGEGVNIFIRAGASPQEIAAAIFDATGREATVAIELGAWSDGIAASMNGGDRIGRRASAAITDEMVDAGMRMMPSIYGPARKTVVRDIFEAMVNAQPATPSLEEITEAALKNWDRIKSQPVPDWLDVIRGCLRPGGFATIVMNSKLPAGAATFHSMADMVLDIGGDTIKVLKSRDGITGEFAAKFPTASPEPDGRRIEHDPPAPPQGESLSSAFFQSISERMASSGKDRIAGKDRPRTPAYEPSLTDATEEDIAKRLKEVRRQVFGETSVEINVEASPELRASIERMKAAAPGDVFYLDAGGRPSGGGIGHIDTTDASLNGDEWETLQEILNAIGALPGFDALLDAYLRGRGMDDPAAAINALRAKAF